MKTKEDLENRLKVLEEMISKSTERIAVYGGLEIKTDDWLGRTVEFEQYQEIVTEHSFIEKTLKYLY